MKIYNGDVELMYSKLIDLPLKGKKNRMRTKFCSILQNHFTEEIEKGRKLLIEEFAERDDKGEIIYVDEEKNQVKVLPEIQKELYLLANEVLIIENNESNEDMLITITDIILDDNCEIEVSGQFTTIFEEWCKEMENVKLSYEK